MLSIPWLLFFTISIPESLLMVLLGFQLYNLEVRFRDAVAIGTISALLSYLVRKLPIVFGLHTFIGIVILILLCWLFTRYPLTKVIYSVLTGFALMVVTQSVFYPLCLALVSMDFSFIKQNPGVESLIFLFQALILGVTYAYFRTYKIFIFDQKDGN